MIPRSQQPSGRARGGLEVNRSSPEFNFTIKLDAKLSELIEVKKLHNGKFWNGLRYQLPSYLKSDDATKGWFIALRYRSNKAAVDRLRSLPTEVSMVSQAVGKQFRCTAIDARRPVSASNIERPEDL